MDENIDLSKNTEIEEALREFENKQQIKTPQASETMDVFKSEKIQVSQELEIPKMIQWVMKLSGGAIKEQKQAEYLLLGFAVLAIIVSLYLFFGSGKSLEPPAGFRQNSPENFKNLLKNEGFQ